MITVPEIVEKIIQKSPYLIDGLRKELINLSALARDIQPEVSEKLIKDVKEGAIVMALKRLTPKLKGKFRDTEEFMKTIGDLTVKSNLIEYTFMNSNTLIEKEAKILDHLKESTHQFITISQGIKETTLILNSNLESILNKIFNDEKIILKKENLSSITIKLPEENVEIPGVYYYILKSLAWSGINLVEAVSTSNEITIIFEEKDIERAFGVIKGISS